jgi:RNA polymerase sigma-70 factor (ECF subfamily)
LPVSRDDDCDLDALLRRACFDAGAVAVVYERMAPGIYRWLRARVADSEVASDLLGETFAQLVCSARRYRGCSDEAAAGWVWGIARNLLRRYYRRQRVEASARERLGVIEVASSDAPDQWHRLDLVVGDRLQDALDALPVTLRRCVWLRVVDELPYDEIASRQGCSTSAARQRVSRGMRRLAATLGGT